MSDPTTTGDEPRVIVTRDGGVARVTWPAAVEIERGAQMWSTARKGRAYWDRKP